MSQKSQNSAPAMNRANWTFRVRMCPLHIIYAAQCSEMIIQVNTYIYIYIYISLYLSQIRTCVYNTKLWMYIYILHGKCIPGYISTTFTNRACHPGSPRGDWCKTWRKQGWRGAGLHSAWWAMGHRHVHAKELCAHVCVYAYVGLHVYFYVNVCI